MNGANILVIFN